MARAGFVHGTSGTGGGIEDWEGVRSPTRRTVALNLRLVRWGCAEGLITVPGQWQSSDRAL